MFHPESAKLNAFRPAINYGKVIPEVQNEEVEQQKVSLLVPGRDPRLWRRNCQCQRDETEEIFLLFNR